MSKGHMRHRAMVCLLQLTSRSRQRRIRINIRDCLVNLWSLPVHTNLQLIRVNLCLSLAAR